MKLLIILLFTTLSVFSADIISPDNVENIKEYEVLTKFIRISHIKTGKNHTCVIDQGQVKCWGANKYGQSDTPAGVSNVNEISLGDNSTCALYDKKTKIKCWGKFQKFLDTAPPRTKKQKEVKASKDKIKDVAKIYNFEGRDTVGVLYGQSKKYGNGYRFFNLLSTGKKWENVTEVSSNINVLCVTAREKKWFKKKVKYFVNCLGTSSEVDKQLKQFIKMGNSKINDVSLAHAYDFIPASLIFKNKKGLAALQPNHNRAVILDGSSFTYITLDSDDEEVIHVSYDKVSVADQFDTVLNESVLADLLEWSNSLMLTFKRTLRDNFNNAMYDVTKDRACAVIDFNMVYCFGENDWGQSLSEFDKGKSLLGMTLSSVDILTESPYDHINELSSYLTLGMENDALEVVKYKEGTVRHTIAFNSYYMTMKAFDKYLRSLKLSALSKMKESNAINMLNMETKQSVVVETMKDVCSNMGFCEVNVSQDNILINKNTKEQAIEILDNVIKSSLSYFPENHKMRNFISEGNAEIKVRLAKDLEEDIVKMFENTYTHAHGVVALYALSFLN